MSFETPPSRERSPEELAREIAGAGDFERILETLKNENLLEEQIERVKKKYEDVFTTIPELTDEDFERFTILELFSPETADHCAETYKIAREKIEKRLSSQVVLAELIQKEGVALEEFFRACLLHDIGKVELPNCVLHNSVHNDEMEMLLRGLVIDTPDPAVVERLKEAGDENFTFRNELDLSTYLQKHNLRSVHFVPARVLLTPEECAELRMRGFDENLSLMDIIKTHELHSREILTKAGLTVEGDLAGAHHNYENRPSRYPIALGTLHISVDVSELLHIADIKQALAGERGYNKKKRFSKPEVWSIILKEAQQGNISPEAAYVWIDDEVQSTKLHIDKVVPIKDAECLRFVRAELERIRIELGIGEQVEESERARKYA